MRFNTLLRLIKKHTRTIFFYLTSKLLSIIILTKKNKQHFFIKRIVTFLYGGIGDQLIIISFLNQISKKIDVTLFLDKRFEELKYFCNFDKIIIYESNKKINFFKYLRKENFSGYAYLSNSSSFIHGLIYLLSNFDTFFGIFFNFKKLFIEKKIIKTEIINRYELFDYLLEKLKIEKEDINSKIFKNNINQNKIKTNIKYDLYKYYVLNCTKTNYWGNVSIPIETWVEFINTNNFFQNKIIVIVGDKSQIQINKKIEELILKAKVINITGKTNLQELGYVILNSEKVFCNDSGVMHLANFFGIKNHSVFTFSDPKIYQNSFYTKYAFYAKLNCQPCVSLSKVGSDNYPPVCLNKFGCSKSIDANYLNRNFHLTN